jgi:hypothetical protein
VFFSPLRNARHYLHLHLSHLADALIQSDLQSLGYDVTPGPDLLLKVYYFVFTKCLEMSPNADPGPKLNLPQKLCQDKLFSNL